MLASAGSILKLHVVLDNNLESLCVYKPEDVQRPLRTTHVSWCHDNTYIGILQEKCSPQILLVKDNSNINFIHTIQVLPNVSALRFQNHTKRTMALGNLEGEAILYDTRNRNILRICNLESPIKFLEFNDADDQLAIATSKAITLFSDPNNVNNFIKYSCYAENCSALKYHPTFPYILAIGYDDGNTKLKNTENGKTIACFQNHVKALTGVNFLSDQKVIVTTGSDKKMCLYDYLSSKPVFNVNVPRAITCSDVSANDKYVSIGLDNGRVCLYDIRNPLQALMCTNAHNCPVSVVAFESYPIFTQNPPEKLLTFNINYGERTANSHLESGDSHGTKTVNSNEPVAKLVKDYMSHLETILYEQSQKFENFILEEIDMIDRAMTKIDVYEIGDSSVNSGLVASK